MENWYNISISKPGLDNTQTQNYRPITLLLSKLLELIIKNRLQEQIGQHNTSFNKSRDQLRKTIIFHEIRLYSSI